MRTRASAVFAAIACASVSGFGPAPSPAPVGRSIEEYLAMSESREAQLSRFSLTCQLADLGEATGACDAALVHMTRDGSSWGSGVDWSCGPDDRTVSMVEFVAFDADQLVAWQPATGGAVQMPIQDGASLWGPLPAATPAGLFLALPKPEVLPARWYELHRMMAEASAITGGDTLIELPTGPAQRFEFVLPEPVVAHFDVATGLLVRFRFADREFRLDNIAIVDGVAMPLRARRADVSTWTLLDAGQTVDHPVDLIEETIPLDECGAPSFTLMSDASLLPQCLLAGLPEGTVLSTVTERVPPP